MRNALKSTPNGKQAKEENMQTESTSAKKLKQARLSFKIIGPESAASPKTVLVPLSGGGGEDKTVAKEHEGKTEARKRKLSSGNESEKPTTTTAQSRQSSTSKENLVVSAATAAKKKKTHGDNGESSSTIVLLDDNDGNSNDGGDTCIGTKVTKDVNTLPIIPKPKSTVVELGKSAGTPKSRRKPEGNSASKIQIKLQLSVGKIKMGKRRKSLRKLTTEDNACDDERLVESSDDIEKFAGKMHSQKKPKLDNANTKQKVDVVDIVCVSSDDGEVSENQDSKINEPKHECKVKSNDVKRETSAKEVSSKIYDRKNEADKPMSPQACEECKKTKVETDDEAEDNVESAVESTSSSDAADTTEQRNDQSGDLKKGNAGVNMVSKKNLTPKQIKLMDQRRKGREEKERKLQEERMQKQREKEERDTAKKRDREEREEQRRKEREEKDEHKRYEREERERKRLAEINTRNEEKRKRTEAKEEEVRKKEEDRKRKEQEKEEAETKKKKAAEAFTKFFVPKITRYSIQAELDKSTEHDDTSDSLAFRPFQVKGDMKLAPVCRKTISLNSRCALDALLGLEALQDDEVIVFKKPLPKSQLYVSELKTGRTAPHKWTRPTDEAKCIDDDDVQIIDTELENAGQAIVEETHGSLERLRAKFYKFQENRRPPYYGTWRKRTKLIAPRRPFAQDKNHFDYEVDSDLEWEEEEEPGESLDGSDDDKEKESEDEDYEVDNEWFVPHGHLSDEELQHEDEDGIGGQNDNDREMQKAKLKMMQQEFVQEMKKKTKKLKPRLIGCMWVDAHGKMPELCPKIIWDTLTSHAMICAVPPLLEERETSERVESLSPNTADKGADKLKRINLTPEILKDLVRLVHGNRNSKTFLIKEFIAHIEATEMAIKNGDVLVPLKSAIREKIDEYAEWQIIEVETVGDSAKKKNKTKKYLCWIVSDDVLRQMDLKDASLPNTWQYTLQPKTKPVAVSETEPKVDADADTDAETSVVIADDDLERSKPGGDAAKGKHQKSSICLFTQVLMVREKTKQQQNEMPPPAAPKTPSHASISRQVTRSSPTAGKTAENVAQTFQPTAATKKRVSLLMSVPRGQRISLPAKNAVISQFLKSSDSSKVKANSVAANPQPKDDGVVILE